MDGSNYDPQAAGQVRLAFVYSKSSLLRCRTRDYLLFLLVDSPLSLFSFLYGLFLLLLYSLLDSSLLVPV